MRLEARSLARIGPPFDVSERTSSRTGQRLERLALPADGYLARAQRRRILFLLNGSRDPTATDQGVLQKEKFNACSKECLHGLPGCIHDGLTLDVEARVEHHFAARGPADGSKQTMEVAIVFAETVCRRADPFTWVIAGRTARCSGRTSAVMIMYGICVPGGTLNQRCACSTETAGANGRNASRILTMALMRSRMAGWPGSARMLRFPSARRTILHAAAIPGNHSSFSDQTWRLAAGLVERLESVTVIRLAYFSNSASSTNGDGYAGPSSGTGMRSL